MYKNTKLFSVLSYITWICWLIAFALHKKDDRLTRHHLNQALVLNLLATVVNAVARMGGIIATVCSIADIGLIILTIIGIYRAYILSDEPLPITGDIHLIG